MPDMEKSGEISGGRIDLLAMTVAQAAKVLSAVSGEWISEDTTKIESDLFIEGG